MDTCKTCDGTDFYEDDGQYICARCNMQLMGSQKIINAEEEDGYMAITTKEINRRERKKRHFEDTGVPWTTTEAFNLIIKDQCNIITESLNLDQSFKQSVKRLWFRFLRKSEIIDLNEDGQYSFKNQKLSHASRFRDVQVVRNKCQSIPYYKNAQRRPRKRTFYGNRVILFYSDDEEDYQEMDQMTNQEINERKVKKFVKKVTSSKDKIFEIIKSLNLMASWKEIDRYLSKEFVSDSGSDSDEATEAKRIKEDPCNDSNQMELYLGSTEIDETYISLSPEQEDSDDPYLSRFTKSISKVVSRNILSKTRTSTPGNICFLNMMFLSKTLSLLYLALRLHNVNVFISDIITWVNQGNIPYFGSVNCFPKDWKLIMNDLNTFLPTISPSYYTINKHTEVLVSFLDLKDVEVPNTKKLIQRFIHDLNLPNCFTDAILSNCKDFFETMFKTKANKMCLRLPYYDRITLMSIVLFLKNVFVLDGKTEHEISSAVKKLEDKNMFIWTDWESYSRTRLETIKHYSIPFHNQNLEDIKDPDIILDFYNQKVKSWRPNHVVRGSYKETFWDPIMKEKLCQGLSAMETSATSTLRSFPDISLSHLTNLTNFALNQFNDDTIKEKLSQDFRNCKMDYYNDLPIFDDLHYNLIIGSCGRTRTPITNWPSPLNHLMELSCILLHCKPEDLYSIINLVQKNLFSSRKRIRRCLIKHKKVYSESNSD